MVQNSSIPDTSDKWVNLFMIYLLNYATIIVSVYSSSLPVNFLVIKTRQDYTIKLSTVLHQQWLKTFSPLSPGMEACCLGPRIKQLSELKWHCYVPQICVFCASVRIMVVKIIVILTVKSSKYNVIIVALVFPPYFPHEETKTYLSSHLSLALN